MSKQIMIDRPALHALANMTWIMEARELGIEIHPTDLLINYAEIDFEITTREDAMIETAGQEIRERIQDWLAGIADPDDVTAESLGLEEILERALTAMIRSVWEYAGETAERDLESMGMTQAAEFADVRALTNDDAYAWYKEYALRLSAAGNDALFVKMQPYILEHLDKGTVRTDLARTLSEEFARYGSVRAEIIARTEATKAFNWGRRWRFDQSPATAGYRYSAIMDRRTTEICSGLHGKSWPVGDPDLDAYTPPNHYRCRSVLVPISKYVDHTFAGTDPGWMDELPEKEREVLRRFMDASWAPVQKTVRDMDVPKPGAVKPKLPTEKPKKEPRKKAPAPAASPPAPADPNAEAIVKRSIEVSQEAAAAAVENFIRHNIGRGVPSAALEGEVAIAVDIQAGKYAGKMITATFDAKAQAMVVNEFERIDGGHVFLRIQKGMTKADKEKILEQVEAIKTDPLFAGLKIQLGAATIKGQSGTIANYSADKDQMVLSARIRDNLRTVYHEVGHRVHNTVEVYENTLHTDNLEGIRLAAGKWKEWTKAADPYWSNSRTAPGTKLLPEDMANRWNYPINAKYHYTKGTKQNFYREMFAESTSVYLENDKAEIEKVQRSYPGLMEFMEEVYQRGYIS